MALLYIITGQRETMIETSELKELSEIYLMALCIWREARGEPISAKWAVAGVIMNRVKLPGWWGHDVTSVILCHYQFSSFNKNDPNSNKFPQVDDKYFTDSLRAARDVYYGMVKDPTGGCDSYYDKSLDSNPPIGSVGKQLLTIGDFRFYHVGKQPNQNQVGAI